MTDREQVQGDPRVAGLADRFFKKQARIGIIGLGYVGLPLCMAMAESGSSVIGFDIDAKKIVRLCAGQSYIQHVAAAKIARLVGEKRFLPTADFSLLREADAILICVPTPLTRHFEPDLSFVIATARSIATYLRADQLVVLESTTYPTTTRDVVKPILEATGLVADRDFFLAFSPEREDPGNPQFSAATIPKVVGGLDPASLELAVALYRKVVVRVVPVSSPEVAEACKILENTFRAVNIALVNELKIIYSKMGIDVWEVIEAAKSKPFGFQAFYPGPGLGGHCIPIDPFYLTWVARKHGLSTRFIELAGEINTSMPAYVVSKIAEALNDRCKPIKESKILLLGMAYKKDVDDPRESPGFELMKLLLEKGASLAYNDPYIPRLPSMRHYPQLSMSSEELTSGYLESQDCVLIVTDHSIYDWNWIASHATLIVDTRNATRGVVDAKADIVCA
jgi:UDP-N-acetyl-D-glucosamine dehydrogenase